MNADTILLGDCIEQMSVLPDKCFDLTVTDIPYDEVNHVSGGLRTLDRTYADRLDFDLLKFVQEVKRLTRGSIYCFCGIQQISSIYAEMRKDMSVRLCHWQKRNPSPLNGNRVWLSATENCVYGKFSSAVFTRHCQPNVWKYPCGQSKIHPTQKPVALFSYLIESSSRRGDIVFDPCIGSGTTAIACIETGRHFLGIEKDYTSWETASRRVQRAVSTDLFCIQREGTILIDSTVP